MKDKSKETSMKAIVYSVMTMAIIVVILNVINLFLLWT